MYPSHAPLPPLITVTMLEDYLDLEHGTLPADQADRAVRGASGAVRDECDWRLDYEEVVGYEPSGDGSNMLFLPTKHLVEVTRVVVDGVIWAPFTVDGDWDYSVKTKTCALRARGWHRWPVEEGRIQINFAHGWELSYEESPGESPGEVTHISGLPDGLVNVLLTVAARSLNNPEGYSSLKVGQVSESYAGAGIPTNFTLSKADIDALSSYKVKP